jgi:extracellular factor (EF) 3-hydroxypalmitic acid methyl ester biosynthesis protein
MAHIAHYEDLAGAEGKLIYYRPQRFTARDIYKQLVPNLRINDTPLILHDLSISGVAGCTEVNAAPEAETGDEVPLVLHLGDTELYRGTGRVTRVEPFYARTKVALTLTSGYIDIAKTVAEHQSALFKVSLENSLALRSELVSMEYRALAADTLRFFRQYRQPLDQLEASWPKNGPSQEEQMRRVLSICEDRALPEWRRIWFRANELVQPIMKDEAVLKATKTFTNLVITPEYLEGPLIRRSYEKPLGYPGDYEVMNTIYRWRYEGRTMFGQLLHRFGLDVAECIAMRMVMMQQTIAQVLADAPPGEPVNVTNLACGPAQEVVNCLKIPSLPAPVRFTLIDQDADALSHAYQQTYPEVVRHQGRATIQCLHVSFSQLMRAGRLFRRIPEQNLIYTVGLLDYLSQVRAKALIADLYGQLAKGGMVVVGNMRDTPSSIVWPLEFICDWSLIYRTEAEMYDLAAGLDAESVEVRPDPTGRVYMLFIRKSKRG